MVFTCEMCQMECSEKSRVKNLIDAKLINMCKECHVTNEKLALICFPNTIQNPDSDTEEKYFSNGRLIKYTNKTIEEEHNDLALGDDIQPTNQSQYDMRTDPLKIDTITKNSDCFVSFKDIKFPTEIMKVKCSHCNKIIDNIFSKVDILNKVYCKLCFENTYEYKPHIQNIKCDEEINYEAMDLENYRMAQFNCYCCEKTIDGEMECNAIGNFCKECAACDELIAIFYQQRLIDPDFDKPRQLKPIPKRIKPINPAQPELKNPSLKNKLLKIKQKPLIENKPKGNKQCSSCHKMTTRKAKESNYDELGNLYCDGCFTIYKLKMTNTLNKLR